MALTRLRHPEPPTKIGAVAMNMNILATIIAMASVVVMMLWGFLGDGWGISWIAVLIGGMIAAVIRMIDKNKKSQGRNTRWNDS